MLARITGLFFILNFVSALAANHEFAAKQIRPVVLRVKAPPETKEVRIQVIDVASGKIAQLNLQDRHREWLQGVYLIHFEKQASPKLQFQVVGQKDAMFVMEDSSAPEGALNLFSTEGEYVQYANAKAVEATTASKKLAQMKEEKKAELQRMNERIQEEQRLHQEADEAARRAEAVRRQEEMTATEKAKREAQAAALVSAGDSAYAANDFEAAVKKYGKAVELDPNRDSIYYRYGIALYRIDQYNKSLAMFSMAEGGSQSKAEHEYYVGLNHLKLKEMDKAHEDFISSRDENEDISATSASLAGSIEFQQRKYDLARKNYEYVLDHSKDPKLDEQAESMLEHLDKIENFASTGKDTMGYSLNAGLSYDGNVLSLGTENLPTDAAGYRFSYGASVYYKFFQSYSSEFSGQLAYSDIYSMDKNFKANSTLQSTDPLQLTASASYKTQIESRNRTYVIGVTPSYSTLTMSAETDERKLMTSTTSMGADVSFPVSANWFSIYRTELAQDASSLSSAGTDDDQSSSRISIGTVQTKILNAKEGKSLSGDVTYVANSAKGKNTTYNKALLGLTYALPGFFKSEANFRLEYMDMNYVDNPSGRHDSGFTISTGAMKSLRRGLMLSLGLQYVNNGSTIEDFKYNKVVAISSLIYSGVLIK